MKNLKTVLCIVLVAISFINCSNDDDTTDQDPVVMTPEVLDTADSLTEIIEGLTANSTKTWKIESAEFSDSPSDISNLYNLRDEEFQFSLNSSSQVELHWKKGFQIAPGEDIESIKSDINVSSENLAIEILISDEITNISSPDDEFIANYNIDSQQIFGLIYFDSQSDPLSVVLSEKLESDYVKPTSTLDNPNELFTFNTGIFRVGFKVSQAQNALYVTNRNDLGQLGEQRAYRYDLNTDILGTLIFTEQDFATKNIEFIDNEIISLGGDSFEIFSTDFAAINKTLSTQGNALISNGSAALDSEIYVFGGIVNGGSDNLSIYNSTLNNFTDVATTPFELNDVDGEIVDQKLYMFGGWSSPDNTSTGSDVVHVYDLEENSFSQVQLPIFLKETYTSVVENLIYVGGFQAADIDDDGDFERFPYLGVFNTLDGSFTEITLNIGDLLDNNRLVHLQVVSDKAYFISSETLEGSEGFTNRVYVADLN